MHTILTIGATDYDGSASGWAAQGITDIEFSWDLEAYWSLSFSVFRICNGYPPFAPGQPVTLDTTADDGTGRRHVFVGDLQRPEGGTEDEGYVWRYAATDLKKRADYVAVTGLDGSGTASFNLSPDDPMALYATSGMTVGAICVAVLQQRTSAAALSAAGVGAYVTLSPPTLPAATLADLALLQVVPPEPVQIRGECLFDAIENFILRWHPQYATWVMPDGTIRCRSIFALDPVAVALPAADGTGDDVTWPAIVGPDCTDCYTAWEVVGLDIQAAYLNQVDGTLKPAWTPAQQAAWTIADFYQPKDASDVGAASAVTSSSCTVTSDFPKAHWALNFWNGPAVQGWIYLENLSATGIDIYEMRQVTSCTALTPGGSATVTWDPGLPLNSTGYTRYRIVGMASPAALVGRDFHIRQPGLSPSPPGNDLDLNTWVGSHLEPRNPKGMPVANNGRLVNVFYPYAFVQWSRTGAWPWFEVPINVQVNPLTGHVILTEPAVLKSAGLAGSTSVLSQRYPASTQEGLYHNVQVVVPFNRGSLSARSPAAGYAGTAYTQFGVQRPFIQHSDAFTWVGDQPALALLAAEHLACVKDAVLSGSIDYLELPANFDVLTPGFCLNVTASGSTTPLDGLDLPVRSATVRWHDDGPTLYSASLRFSNKKRPFEGDALYIHPALAGGTFGMQDGEVFGIEGAMMAQASAAQQVAQRDAASRLPTMESIAADNNQALGSIAADNARVGSQLAADSDPGSFLGGIHDQVAGEIAAGQAPIAQELAAQAQAMGMGGPGDDPGRMAGSGPARAPGRDASGVKTTAAERAAGGRRAKREKDRDQAVNQRRADRKDAQQRAARQGAAERAYSEGVENEPVRDAAEARKKREQQDKDHARQIRSARERGVVGPKEPLDRRLKRQAGERTQQRTDAEFGPLSPEASGSADQLPIDLGGGDDDANGGG